MKKRLCLLSFAVLVSCHDAAENINKEDVSHESVSHESRHACTKVEGELQICEFEKQICEGESKVYQDEKGDVQKPFVDLVGAEITTGEMCFQVRFEVAELPSQLSSNHQELNMNASNYSWSVWFDVDEDKQPSSGDVMLSIDAYKFETSEILKNPVDMGQGTLIVINGLKNNHVDNEAIAIVNYFIEDNSLILQLPINLHPILKTVSFETPVFINSYFDDGNAFYADDLNN